MVRLLRCFGTSVVALWMIFNHPISTDARMVIIDRGAAAHYARSYDNGGWDGIIAQRIAWGQHDPNTFPYSDDGYYCVRPGYVFGNILTLTNGKTGETIRCTVADMVAPQDRSVWFSRWVIETSYAAFVALDLDDGNDVIVSAWDG